MADLLQGAPLPDLDPDDVAAASTWVRRYCRWHIAPSQAATKTIPGAYEWWLPSKYVTAVASVTDYDTSAALTDWEWEQSGRMWFVNRRTLPRRMTIAFTHGYPVCPADIRREIRKMAQSQGPSPITATLGAATVQYQTAPDRSVLEPYRLQGIA